MRGLGESLKGQQETGGSKIKKTFLTFLFKRLSFEQKVQRARMGKSLVYPAVMIGAGHGRFSRVARLDKAI